MTGMAHAARAGISRDSEDDEGLALSPDEVVDAEFEEA
jgi:hypothetical protein